MTDVLLLHDNAPLLTSLRTRKTTTKIVCTVLPHPTRSPDLASFDCHLFGPVKDALRGLHIADDKELKQSFCDVFRSRGREFYNNGTQRLTQRWRNCSENDVEFVGK
jgi:hypothetical protein